MRLDALARVRLAPTEDSGPLFIEGGSLLNLGAEASNEKLCSKGGQLAPNQVAAMLADLPRSRRAALRLIYPPESRYALSLRWKRMVCLFHAAAPTWCYLL